MNDNLIATSSGMIPIEVQQPCKPKTATLVGWAEPDATVDVVNHISRVPLDCIMDTKLIRNKKRGDRWSIVANVIIRKSA